MHRRYQDTQDPNAEIDNKSQKVGYFLEQFLRGGIQLTPTVLGTINSRGSV